MPAQRRVEEIELRRLLEDETEAPRVLAELFEPQLFSPRLAPREDVTIVPEEEIVQKGLGDAVVSKCIDLANSVCTRLRQRRYLKVIKHQPDLPRAVAEGDSWFLHPQISDIVDQLFPPSNPRLAIYSLAAAGDDLAGMWRQHQYLEAAQHQDAELVLLSGGGNDILGREFPGYLNDHTPGKPGENVGRLLNRNFDRKLRHLRQVYTSIVEEIARERPRARVILHGYDFVRPGVEKPDAARHQHKGKWLGRHMTAAGIEEAADREGIVRRIVNRFNDEVLVPVAKNRGHVVRVDLRDTVGSHEWFDEIHPNANGFNAVAVRMYEALI